MSKRSIVALIILTIFGIVFGVVLASSYKGVDAVKYTGDSDVQLGAPSQIKNPSPDIKAFNKAFTEVSKAVTPTVVSINVVMKAKEKSQDMKDFFHFFGPDFKLPDTEPQQGSGSGVIISGDGYVLTNNHVVDDADDNGLEVIMNDTRRLKAKIIGTDPTTDLAVIKVDEKELPTVAFGNSDALEVGEWVIAIGNPLGLSSTVTAGIVSAIGRSLRIIPDNQGYSIENFIQTDAAINPGNSGGPLVNLNGEVVGINAAIATTNARYQGYGFAIPINLARAVAEDLIKFGKVRRGYLGVNIQTVDETLAKANGLDKAKGVLVQTVVAGGAAEVAGIHEGDIILSVDGKEVNKSNELQSYIGRKHPGDDVVVKIFRNGKTMEKTISLRSRKEEVTPAKDTEKENRDNETEKETAAKLMKLDNLGLTIRPLTSDEKKELSIDKGVLVSDVKKFSEANNRGLTKNDVILEADKKDIYSTKDLKGVIENHKAGDAILLRVKKSSGEVVFVGIEIPK